MTRKLGVNQQGVLCALDRHGCWYSYWGGSAGWLWDTDSNTRRILESLSKRGLVDKERTSDHPHGLELKDEVTVYTITEEGKKHI